MEILRKEKNVVNNYVNINNNVELLEKNKSSIFINYGLKLFINNLKVIIHYILLFLLIIMICIFIRKIIPSSLKNKIKYDVYGLFINSEYDLNDLEIENNIFKLKILLNDKAELLKNNDIENLKNELSFEYFENSKYINFEKYIKVLNQLDIKYLNRDNQINSHAVASYNNIFNIINVYDKENFSNEVILHEFNHIFNNNKLIEFYSNYNNKNSDILIEGINELFTREYYYLFNDINNDYDKAKSYDFYMPYIYMLSEIIDQDTLIKFKFEGKEEILVYNLVSKDCKHDINKAYELLNMLKDNNIENFYRIYNYYFNQIYNYNISNDLIIISYLYNLNNIPITEKEKLNEFIEQGEIMQIIPKGYISNEFIQKNNDLKIIYKDSENTLKEKVITADNRYFK